MAANHVDCVLEYRGYDMPPAAKEAVSTFVSMGIVLLFLLIVLIADLAGKR